MQIRRLIYIYAHITKRLQICTGKSALLWLLIFLSKYVSSDDQTNVAKQVEIYDDKLDVEVANLTRANQNILGGNNDALDKNKAQGEYFSITLDQWRRQRRVAEEVAKRNKKKFRPSPLLCG